MKILIACEFSGITRDAFLERGHNAISCDLEDTERPGPHIKGDVAAILDDEWDMMIAFPPCTYLARSGARWWRDPGKRELQCEALQFVGMLLKAPIRKIALENPPGAIGTHIRPATQYIQPWQYGHGEVKMTGLWLKGLPSLRPTNIVSGREPRVWYAAPGPDRWRERSRAYTGIAAAMAEQWSENSFLHRPAVSYTLSMTPTPEIPRRIIMALEIKQHAPVSRPVTRSGRAGTSELPALVAEVRPLLSEALQLSTDKALPLVVPVEQATDLVRALRAAGEEKNVTVRFKRFPRLNENGEQEISISKKNGKQTPVSDPFEYTNKAKTSVRVTFWTTTKVVRKSKES